MRLGRPASTPGDGSVNGSRWIGQKLKYRYLFLIIIIVVAVLLYIYEHDKKKKPVVGDSTTTQDIRLLSGSKDAGDKRIVISAYLSEKQYNKASKLAIDLAKSTDATEDYMTVVRICAGYSVDNKSDCLRNALNVLEARLSTMSFFDAYNVGDELDGANFNKDQAKFYQRAYDTYDTSRAQYLMTKDQLKAKINELNK